MKQKYLLGMLFGGMLLTACSVEDDLNSSPVAQKANSSAPVFTISFDDQTRAVWNGGVNEIKFEKEDKMSLFHGVEAVSADDNNIYPSFVGYGNAVYKGEMTADGFKYSTQAMVKKGGAIMVWPVDTTWANTGAKAPILRVKEDQDETTKLTAPYISDVMTIADWHDLEDARYEGDLQQTAGYGREYKVALRRVASTLILNLERANHTEIDKIPGWTNAKGESVAPLTLDKVKIETIGNDEPFTTAISVVASKDMPAKKTTKGYEHWTNQADVDVADANELNEYAAALTTTDVATDKKNTNAEADTAKFTLLPVKTGANITDKEGQIVLTTTYGTITLVDASTEDDATDAEKIWHKNDAQGKPADIHTVTGGLNSILDNDKVLWAKEATSTMFKNEKMGGPVTRCVTVDMKLLDMNNLHIKNEKQLLDVLTVYENLKNTLTNKNVTLVLDGDNATDKTFTLTNTGWKDLQEKLGKHSANLKIDVCDGTENGHIACEVIRLKNEGGEEKLPENNLKFESEVVLELAGNAWAWKEYDADYTNVTEVWVADGTTLTMAGDYKIKTSDPTIVNNGTIELDGDVRLNQDLKNNGTIKIDAADRLLVQNKKLLENEAGANGFAEGGVIENGGTLAVVDKSDATINNYGTIKVLNGSARTLITNNEEVDSKKTAEQFKEEFSKTNRIGSIILYSNTASQDLTSVEGEQGFIKLYVSKYTGSVTNVETVTSTVTGGYANYIIVDGNANKITSLGDKVKYVEINNNIQTDTKKGIEVRCELGSADEALELDGIIIRDKMSINIPTTANIKTNVLYVPGGEVVRAGLLDYSNKLTGYYGGNEGDYKNIFVTKGGEN